MFWPTGDPFWITPSELHFNLDEQFASQEGSNDPQRMPRRRNEQRFAYNARGFAGGTGPLELAHALNVHQA
jgi:hypothetical protein